MNKIITQHWDTKAYVLFIMFYILYVQSQY